MSLEINLAVTTTGSIAAAINKAHSEKLAETNPEGLRVPRKTKIDWPIPGTKSLMQVTRNEPDLKVKGNATIFDFSAKPADFLLGLNCYSSASHIHKATPVMLALFKASMKENLPSLPDEILDAITADDCSIESLTVPYYFNMEDETKAYQAFLDWLSHLKIVLDGVDKLPIRSNASEKKPTKIMLDPDDRNAFIATFPFGHARISVIRDLGEYPATINKITPTDNRKKIQQLVRNILCIEIKVDIRKFYYFNSENHEVQLPYDYRRWDKKEMKEDPLKIIFESFLYAAWLGADLATDIDEVDPQNLESKYEEVVATYLKGENTFYHNRINKDSKKYNEFRRLLIKKARIDIQKPWVINKLNLDKLLSPDFTYENRLLPQNNEELAPHTLSHTAINQTILDLDTAMQGKPGWWVDLSNIEE
ncbi:hypothetical protein os1_02710 [Comamonadaceae bacterium OS-1]|nr:hypothetical protein os1_02710 [Comamonadaceae bacterium OS-1]